MSDFSRALKPVNSAAKIKAMERKEEAEGVRNALRAGRGDVVAGAKKLHFEKEGLLAQLKKARVPKKGGRK